MTRGWRSESELPEAGDLAYWEGFFKALAVGGGVMAAWLYALGFSSVVAELIARGLVRFAVEYSKESLLAEGLAVVPWLSASWCAGALLVWCWTGCLTRSTQKGEIAAFCLTLSGVGIAILVFLSVTGRQPWSGTWIGCLHGTAILLTGTAAVLVLPGALSSSRERLGGILPLVVLILANSLTVAICSGFESTTSEAQDVEIVLKGDQLPNQPFDVEREVVRSHCANEVYLTTTLVRERPDDWLTWSRRKGIRLVPKQGVLTVRAPTARSQTPRELATARSYRWTVAALIGLSLLGLAIRRTTREEN